MTHKDLPQPGSTPEFSRRVSLDEISDTEIFLDIEASAQERSALARRFELLAVDTLTARVGLRRCMARDGSGKIIRVSLAIDATITQSCVVTLDPVTSRISETDIVAEFRPADAPELTSEVDIAPEAYDPPEILIGEAIDVGELTAEYLALAIDPYPRAEGANPSLTASLGDDDTMPDADHPFAALKGWSNRSDTDKA